MITFSMKDKTDGDGLGAVRKWIDHSGSTQRAGR